MNLRSSPLGSIPRMVSTRLGLSPIPATSTARQSLRTSASPLPSPIPPPGSGSGAFLDEAKSLFAFAPDLEFEGLPKVLIDEQPLQMATATWGDLPGHGQARTGRETAVELTAPVLSQKPHCISPASGAVPHLWEVSFGLPAKFSSIISFPGSGTFQTPCRHWVHGHAVEHVNSQLRHPLGDGFHMVVVYGRNHDGVHLTVTPWPSALDGAQLPVQEQSAPLSPR